MPDQPTPSTPKPEALVGFCPVCYKPGKTRERRPNGNDTCVEGHVYPSASALKPKGATPAVVTSADVLRPAKEAKLTPEATANAFRVEPPKPSSQIPMPTLTPEQEKAVALIISGHAFLLVAMRPTKQEADGSYRPCDQKDATGCDFLTCLHGDKDTLMGAKDELAGVIERLYTKRGML